MAARFIVTDHAAASEAAAKLPAAGRRLALRTEMAVAPLKELEDGDPPVVVLEALARVDAAQERVTRAKAELLLMLSDTGASERTIANAAGMHHSVVRKLLDRATVERDGETAEAAHERARVEYDRRMQALRAQQERESQLESDRVSAEIHARRGSGT